MIFVVANLSFLPIKQGIIFDISFGMILLILAFGLFTQIFILERYFNGSSDWFGPADSLQSF
ncbi:hypothetical protein DU508_21885 [Pedobacter chinensis]|uniref:Uncharacterized protein n=1 Tax=Pedobacter chinensis TaxID=2282421 RepID=A0A369PPB0_9SPHI|nr:hypothetical protein DU508_21885 [Pedobacter chinensis]